MMMPAIPSVRPYAWKVYARLPISSHPGDSGERWPTLLLNVLALSGLCPLGNRLAEQRHELADASQEISTARDGRGQAGWAEAHLVRVKRE